MSARKDAGDDTDDNDDGDDDDDENDDDDDEDDDVLDDILCQRERQLRAQQHLLLSGHLIGYYYSTLNKLWW